MGDKKSKQPPGQQPGGEEMEVVQRHSGFGAEDMFKPTGAKDSEVDSLTAGIANATTAPGDHGAHRVGYGSTGARTAGGPMPQIVTAPGSVQQAELPGGLSPKAKLGILIGGGVGIVVLGIVLLLLVPSPDKAKEAALAASTGSIEVVSSPAAGAEIWMNGAKTEFVTPHTFSGIPIESSVRFAVKRAGYKIIPPEQSVKVPTSKMATATFELKMAKPLSIVSEPSNAEVTLNGEAVAGTTPLTLPMQPFGEKLVIGVDLDGYFANKMEVVMSAETSTLSFTLVKAKTIGVTSEPEGANVFIDDQPRGTTPAMNLKVPEGNFKLRVERPGYKTSVQKLNTKKVKETIAVTLSEQSLLGLPLTKSERADAINHTSALNRAKAAADRAKKRVADAEKMNDKMQNATNAGLQDRARAEQALQDAQTAVEAADEALTEAQTKIDEFRNEVMQRIDAEAQAKQANELK